MRQKQIVISIALSAACSVFGYDWPSSGSVTLTTDDCDERGEVVVTDADYAKANGLSGITVGANVKLVFATTKAPTVALSGTGTFIKRGDAEWTLATAQGNFGGDWELEGGVTIVDVNGSTAFGKDTTRALRVRVGASFTVATTALKNWRLHNRKLYLAGTGYQNKGVYYSLGNTSQLAAWGNVELEDDATIRLEMGYLYMGGSSYEFNGHDFTILGSNAVYVRSGSPRNGRFVVGDGTDTPTLRENGTFKTTDTEFETVLNDGATLEIYNEPAAYPGKVTVNGAVTVCHGHTSSSDACVDDETTVCLAGPVNLARADSVLTCKFLNQSTVSYDPYLMKIAGYVYGPGGITVDASGSRIKTVVLSCPTNAFTGPVTVTSGELRLAGHGAIPDYGKVTVENGAALIASGAPNSWTDEDLADLGKVTFGDLAVCVVDRSAQVVPGTFVYAAADLEAASAPDAPATLRVGALPADTVISVTGDFTKAFQPVAWGGNTVAVAGAVPRLSSVFVTDGTRPFSGTLAVTNAGTTTFDYPYYVGTQGGARDVVFKNTSVTMEGLRKTFSGTKTSADYCPDFTNNAIVIGSYDYSKRIAHPGRFTIGENCTITARCMCSYGPGTTKYQTQGALVQTAGETCFLGSTDDSRAALWGYYAPCSVTLTGGTMTWLGYHQIGYNSTFSTFLQTGGEFYLRGFSEDGKCKLDISSGGAAANVDWLQTGGTSKFFNEIILARSGGAHCSITVMGSNTVFESGFIRWGFEEGANPILTIRDGAVCRCGLSVARYTESQYAEKGFYPVFNCYSDGGWIAGSTAPLGGASGYGPTRIASAGAGFGFDTANVNGTANYPIHSVTGNGVAGIEGGWTRLETDLVIAPQVEILGDGTNATAFALMDGGAITNILITNPGENYSVATARVMTAMGLSSATTFTYSDFPCTLKPNVPGGLNKRGAGRLSLAATNDYVGATRVFAGTLRLNGSNLISPASALSVEGGTFDFNGHTNAFRAVGGTSGKITGCAASELAVETLLAGTATNLVLDGVSLRVTGEFTLSGAELAAGGGPAYATAVSFDEGAGIRLTGIDGLDPEKRGGYMVLSATGGLTDVKVLNEDELPAGWRLVFRDNALRLDHPKGCILIVR